MKYKYNIKNLDCANCAKKIEDKIAKINRTTRVVATNLETVGRI